MPDLETGVYQPSTQIKVTYWAAPDKDGNGDEVWVDRTDEHGQVLERVRQKDANGEQVYHYEPPEGFENRPGYDHTDNYVRIDHRGRILRDVNGNAMGISPGHALVEYPDGRSELLTDEYARFKFAQSHDKLQEKKPVAKKATPSSSGTGE